MGSNEGDHQGDYEGDHEEGHGLTRRSLLKTSLPVLMGVGVGFSTTSCGGAAIPASAVTVMPPDELTMGEVQQVEGYDVFLIRNEEGVAAISGQCTHQACGVNPTGEGFHCPCHGSEFATDGTVLSGPAQEDLPWFAVRVEGGRLVVDPTQTVPQGTYTPI